MASLQSVKEEQLRSYQLSHGVQAEAPTRNVRALLNRDVPVVDLSSSSSSGSERSLANGDAGEVSSVARSPGVKHRLISNGVLTCAGKRPKLEPIQQLGSSIDDYDDMALRPEGASIIAELPLGFLEPLHPTSNGAAEIELPADFLEPLPSDRGFAIDMPPLACISPVITTNSNGSLRIKGPSCKQFWKAGDYEGDLAIQKPLAGGMDHVRVHPKFLHSNATSHKWALGAIAELLDNALDEVVNGASFVNLDMIKNPKDGSPMLFIEDDGGGMNPDRMRQCMSLGYSAKSKSANTIGQYGNGFKTSTMRLGADVIVFSRSPAHDGCSPTESIGMLSYSFLRDTGQEDIIVPMVDYAIEPYGLRKIIRSNVDDWNRNMETIKHWSPYLTEADLLNQFKEMKTQGTRIVVYSLWEDDQGQLELDFDADKFDIQVRGANRDEKKISMAEKFPNSRHYLTYRHSLRSYVSILYLRLPAGFQIIMRGKVVEHHSLVDDLMFTQELTYKPQGGPEQAQKDNNQMMAVVTIGFVKDAKDHIDVQGFNVYHKNRLIKPFWRIWNSPSSMGRGVIGVLEANFVEPAHDKQGFERTTVLARLEARLLQMQKTYWGNHCHKVGYVSGSVKKGGNASPKVYSSKDSLAAQRVPGLPAPQHISGEVEVHSPGLPVSVLRSARTQMQRIPARVYHNETFTGSMMTSEPNAVENPHSMHHAMVDDAATRGSNQQHSSTTIIHKVDCVQQQRDPPSKERSLADLGRMLTKNILTTEGLQCNGNQVGITDNCSHSEHLSEEGEILTQGQEEESLHRDGTLNSDTLFSLQAEIERNKQLEAKIIDMEQKIQLLRRSHDKLEREKEFLNERLHEDRKQRALEDEELRKKLKEALMRVKELEAENTRLQLG